MGTNFAVAPGEYLQEWIDGNGMSVGEFAVELGVTVAEIEDLLTGKEAIPKAIRSVCRPDCHHRIGRLCFMACSCSYEYQITQRRFRGR